MGQNHSVGGDWHGGIKENCPKCTPIKTVVVEAVKPVIVSAKEDKPKKKVGV